MCEKPLGMNAQEVKTMYSLAKQKNLFLMEALWSRCLPSYKKLKDLLANSNIGEVKHCTAQLSLDILGTTNLSGGCIRDLGIYPVYFASLVFRGQRPTKILG